MNLSEPVKIKGTVVSLTTSHRIVSTVLHQIDVENSVCNHVPISNDYADLETYLSDLLREINEKPQKRAFEFLRETTEFFTTLKSFHAEQDLANNKHATDIAKRLLDKEVDTDSRYGHLGSPEKGLVKKGSFLQFLYRSDNEISYLGVKIEHQSFIDENDFRKKIGLSIANKIYKACKVSFDASGMPHNVLVFDTNSKPSSYWWKEFLELKQVRDDGVNTKKACEAVIKVVNEIKNDYPVDYTILRNASIAAFKQQGEMKFDEFLTNTFLHYEPENKQLASKLPALVAKLTELPEKKQFDSRFTLVPSEVSYKQTKVKLSHEIALSYEEGIADLDQKIWAEQTESGKQLVVIHAPDAFHRFKLKARE